MKQETQSKEQTGRKRQGLKCVYFNARSIRNKVRELKAWISTKNCDVVAITETWIAQGQEWILEVPGFRCLKKNSEDGKRGGGWHC